MWKIKNFTLTSDNTGTSGVWCRCVMMRRWVSLCRLQFKKIPPKYFTVIKLELVLLQPASVFRKDWTWEQDFTGWGGNSPTRFSVNSMQKCSARSYFVRRSRRKDTDKQYKIFLLSTATDREINLKQLYLKRLMNIWRVSTIVHTTRVWNISGKFSFHSTLIHLSI